MLAVVGGGGRGGRGDDGFGVEVTMVEGEGTKLVAGCGREEPTPPCDVVFGGCSAMLESLVVVCPIPVPGLPRDGVETV